MGCSKDIDSPNSSAAITWSAAAYLSDLVYVIIVKVLNLILNMTADKSACQFGSGLLHRRPRCSLQISIKLAYELISYLCADYMLVAFNTSPSVTLNCNRTHCIFLHGQHILTPIRRSAHGSAV